MLDTARRLDDFIEEFTRNRADAMQRSIDRVTVKAVGTAKALDLLAESGIGVEGAIPLACHRGHVLIFAGWNHPDRTVPPAKLRTYRALLAQTRITKKVPNRMEDRARDAGLQVNLLAKKDDQTSRRDEVGRFAEAFGAFGLGETDIEQLLVSANTTIAYLTNPLGAVASAVVAERVTIDLEGHGSLVLVEITEAITRVEFRGQGLYRNLSGYIVDHIRFGEAGPLHAVFGECNLSSPGVIYAARRNGRRFVTDDAELYGGPHRPDLTFGILCQNFSVSDGVESRAYNDFALSYVDLTNCA
ncbi:hypothetical protein ACFVAV_18700 [Nocardia sp. NPDC057663]|uniref:hypothetical protein n=1 Tax=Nocardia sp. NPDC057663 TaxID=3346201 RepID=UPI00366D3479